MQIEKGPGFKSLEAEQVEAKLGLLETQAAEGLQIVLVQAGVTGQISEQYRSIFPTPTDELVQQATIVSRRGLKEFFTDPLTLAIASFYVGKTGLKIVSERPDSIEKALNILADNAVHWAGESVTSPENFLVATGIGLLGAGIYVGVPAKVIDFFTKLAGERTAAQVQKQAEILQRRLKAEQDLREGKADLSGKVGPHIQIDIGISDPTAESLIILYRDSGLKVVTYWDKENKLFDLSPAWQATGNIWTNVYTLLRGDVEEAELAVTLVSNLDDVFLSRRKQDPYRESQDMKDSEAIGAHNARNAARRKKGLSPIQSIIVTNGKREIGMGIARKGGMPYKTKTVEEVVREIEGIHLIDPDKLVIKKIAKIAREQGLPLELATDDYRKEEYEKTLKLVIDEHNTAESDNLRYAKKSDGKKTLTVVYGDTDDDTIFLAQSYLKDFSGKGDIIVVMNNPNNIAQLPQWIKDKKKYLCVGTTIARAVYEKSMEIISSQSNR